VLSRLSSLLRSKKGFIGALVLFYGAVHGIFGLVQDATYAASNWGTIVGFLTSGIGNLCVIVVGIVLVLWAVVSQQPEAQPLPQSSATPDTNTQREVERLEKQLRRVEQERDRYRALQVDPNAKRLHEEESLRHSCILLGQELLQFMKVHGYSDETVNRFVQRHEWKVNELRDELDERAWFTMQERDALTFNADDYSHKIEEIANTLILLGRGH
jgi:hypothetical protein